MPSLAAPYTSTSVPSRSMVAPPARSTARRRAGSSPTTRQQISPIPSSIPATWAGPNRSASCTAVVEAGVATADSASPAVSARRRSNPVQNCAPHICACATATTPEAGVNDASGAPTRTRPAKPGIFSTERVSFPQRRIGVSTTPIVPAGKASVRLCHAVLYFYPRIRVRPEEAAALNKRHLDLPDVGWGWLHLDGAEPHAGREWTDSGRNRDRRQLKQRERGETRDAPCPPELTKFIHAHIAQFGLAADGRLFRGERNDEELQM